MTALLPCPLCGAEAEACGYADSDLTFVQCTDCGCSVDVGRDCWGIWNDRPTPVPGAHCKPSRCCEGELLVPMHSTNTKLCTGCKTEQPWPLEPGQKRTYE